MSDLLISGVDTSIPLSFAQVTTGETFIVSGRMKAKRWNNVDLSVVNAGMPKAAGTISGTCGAATGSITGTYYVAVRYVDKDDTYGDLSSATSFTVGNCSQLSFTGIPVPTDSRVHHKQVWRTTQGETTTFYLDLDNIATGTTTATSSKVDTTLSANTSLPVLNADGTLNARRFGIPPDWKTVVIAHQDRTFWGVNAVINDGHISLTSGSTTATVYGVTLPDVVVGRRLYVPRHETLYTISACSSSTGQITLSSAFAGSTDLFSRYEIQTTQTERNRIYFSESGEPESVPSVNAIDLVHSEGDTGAVTSMMSMGAFVWLMTPNRIYRWTYQKHPVDDGNIYLTASRGCVNQNCWTLVDGQAYILDKEGCYVFNGGTTNPISRTIQDYFRPGGGIVWESSKWFHVSHSPTEEVVKFFVSLDGSEWPKHALCYHYRSSEWEVEEYPWPIPCSTTGLMDPHHRLLIGTTHSRIVIPSEGALDGPSMAIDARQSPSTTNRMNVTIGGTFTASDLAYAPVTIVSGRGAGQTRRILYATSAGKLYLDQPWQIKPNTSSVLQIGGIEWRFKTRLFRLLDTEHETNRTVQVVFEPVTDDVTMDMAVYKNHSVTPASFVIPYNRQDGAQVNNALDGITITMNDNPEGWVYWSLDDQHDFRGEATRYIQVGLSGVQNTDQIMIYGVDIAGVSQ